MVEHRPFKPLVEGPNPFSPIRRCAMFYVCFAPSSGKWVVLQQRDMFALWSNGRTGDPVRSYREEGLAEAVVSVLNEK